MSSCYETISNNNGSAIWEAIRWWTSSKRVNCVFMVINGTQ